MNRLGIEQNNDCEYTTVGYKFRVTNIDTREVGIHNRQTGAVLNTQTIITPYQ